MAGRDGDLGANLPKRPIYLDYQATTPVDPRVLDAMLPFFGGMYGNPHSSSHALGREAAAAVETARESVAEVIGAEGREIVFTSGATEANNLAIIGAGRFRRGYREGRDHIVTVATEHKCVLESCAALEREGFRVTRLPVGKGGLIDLELLREAVTGETALVSVMAVNNEIGVVQPLAEIGAICREHGAWFHTDAAQAFGKAPIDVEAMRIDLLSISGHKAYAPKGVGALYVRRRPRVRLEPLFHGGGQERGLRSGTLPTPLCVGLGEAAGIARKEMAGESERLHRLSRWFLAALERQVPDVIVNGDMDARFPGNLNLAFPGVPAERLIEGLPDVAVATGSACSSAAVEPSYVLRALGLDDGLAASSIRIGFGRFTTESEIDIAADSLARRIAELRASSNHAAGDLTAL